MIRTILIVFCILFAGLCFYATNLWHQERIARIETEELYVHYRQQWIDTVLERNRYQDLYEDCHNQTQSTLEGYSK